MAISRTQKEEQVATLKQEFEKSAMTVLTAYSGLSVQDSQNLRKEMKENNGMAVDELYRPNFFVPNGDYWAG